MRGQLTKADPPPEGIRYAYRGAAGKWAGCDWPTRFGSSGLDLNGLRSGQAALMARATAGDEAADWRAAAAWLAEVESEAALAEEAAGATVACAEAGDLHGALGHARHACAVESKYHRRLVWQPLYDAITAALAAAARG